MSKVQSSQQPQLREDGVWRACFSFLQRISTSIGLSNLNWRLTILFLCIFLVLLCRHQNLRDSTNLAAQKILLRGQITNTPRYLSNLGIQLSLLARVGNADFQLLLYLADVPWSDNHSLGLGDEVEALVKIKPLKNKSAYQSYLLRRGYAALGRVEWIRLKQKSDQSLTANQQFVRSLHARLGNSEALSVLVATVFANRDLLNRGTEDLFRELGLSHILVVSGFHIGVVYCLIFVLAKACFSRWFWLLRRIPVHILSSVPALLVVAQYVYFISGGIPAIRATIVLSVVVVGKLIGRESVSFRTLVISAMVVCLIWPNVYEELGFQLSYMALLGILAARNWLVFLDSRRLGIEKSISWIKRSLIYSLGAWLGTLPLVLSNFRMIVPLAALTNVVFITPLSLVFVCFGGFVSFCVYLDLPGALYGLELLIGFSQLILELMYWTRDGLERLDLACWYFSADKANSTASVLWGFITFLGLMTIFLNSQTFRHILSTTMASVILRQNLKNLLKSVL